ncbi:MAG: signal peptide peptidase SppA [Rhodospirillaceae bacterium]|jgi:protease IV|nr:signal peptide peptidase SppA [Rhodospirillaceae bacterium]MBT3628673.1 signal peptide peptidase SppA [Rhodospirillaceae bacterium]MBT3926615.1 signal peptide peptidase SppA [Rhodospirillaceae bacterium]MBT4427310.1 signal peptide peptidase SppA [Rhodospirillaceae bacterium]MBT5037508.1 signal peptide peptidase SppA [Rhodospirillaceae bacterium]
MMLDPDRLLDRRRLKRGVAVWRALAVVAVIALIVVAIGRFALDGPAGGDYIARLWVTGLIIDDPLREEMLAEIAEDSDVRALIVRIDSPGGTMAGSEALYLGLRKVAATKPVIAVMGGTAASGGYMTALAAEHILARNSTVTGSIGVILQTAEVSRMLSDLGIVTEAIKSAPLKGVPSPFETLNESGRAAAQAVVDDMYDLFIDLLAERRGLERPVAEALADGRVFTGRQAVANGLVDEIGGEPEALAWLDSQRGVPATLPLYDLETDEREDIVERLVSSVGGAVLPRRLTLDGLLAVWHPGLGRE